MANLHQPVAIITGAGSGIGRAIACTLSAHGYSVALIGRRLSRLQETAALLPDATEHTEISIDVGDAVQVSSMIEQVMLKFGRLDVLINNAGFAPNMPIEETLPEIIDEVYRVNALGPAYAIAKAWPIFKAQHARDGSGACIINISTRGTADPFAGFFAYAASKAAVNLMVKSCAGEGRAIGVRAFSIAPGSVETEMLRSLFTESDIPPAECLSPEDVAQVVFECINGLRDAQNGETIFI